MAFDFGNWENPDYSMGQGDTGYTPDFEIPAPNSEAYNIWGDGIDGDLTNTSGFSIGELLKSLSPEKAGNAGQRGSTTADLGSILGAFSSGEKANRVLKGNLTQNYDRLMMDAQKDRNSNESDAMKKLAQTSYITGGGSQFKAPSLNLNGKGYEGHDLGFGPVAPSDEEKQGAKTLQSQLQARLSPGGSYTPQDLSGYADPGLAENIGSYGGAAVSGIGALLNGLGSDGDGQSGGNGVGSTVSDISKGLGTAGSIAGLVSKFGKTGSSLAGAGSAMGGLLGKAVPIAGAVTGAYGLAKNQSVGSDVMSGMGAGASIGSFGGPIGTAVGAGVGALVGALRGAFSVTGKEHGGRDAQAAIAQNLSKLSTPSQQAEAAKAGWPDPNQALSLIVMRDKLVQSGLPGPQAEAKAEAIMHSMWDAEKSGSNAVAQASSPIQSMMGTGFGGTSTSSYPSGTDAFSRNARV